MVDLRDIAQNFESRVDNCTNVFLEYGKNFLELYCSFNGTFEGYHQFYVKKSKENGFLIDYTPIDIEAAEGMQDIIGPKNYKEVVPKIPGKVEELLSGRDKKFSNNSRLAVNLCSSEIGEVEAALGYFINAFDEFTNRKDYKL